MALMEVLIHVPGDREAAIRRMDELHIQYKEVKGALWIKNSHIYLDQYGNYGNRLCLYTDTAKSDEGTRVTVGWGDSYMPFKEQVAIFNAIKRAMMKHRAEFYKNTELEMARKKEEREKRLKEIYNVIDFESRVLKEEHQFEVQIKKTIAFITGLQKDFPRATFNIKDEINIDAGILALHIKALEEILAYIRSLEIEAVLITHDVQSPVKIAKAGHEMRLQKKHMAKLSSKLKKFVKGIRDFLKGWIKAFQITTLMRAHLRQYYGALLNVYSWYADLFKQESRKPVIS